MRRNGKLINLQVRQASRAFIILGVFAIAMGFLEAIVVVYLRQIYYPQGFQFPLTLLSPQMLSVEWIREIATIIMLAAVGIIAGKNNLQRLLYFLYSFAIWDILYYVALFYFLKWPPSLLTWDILFLIPVPWIGPVLAPLICSLTMIFMAFSIIIPQEKGRNAEIRIFEWTLIFGGALIIFYTYIKDYFKMILESGILSGPTDISKNEEFWKTLTSYIPAKYSWGMFFAGEALILLAMFFIIRRLSLKRNE